MKHLRYEVSLVMLLIVMGCSKSGDKPEPESTIDPIAVGLRFPENNSECILGLNQNVEKALVEFRWEEAENDFYELVLENLSSAHITRIKTSSNVAEILLDKNTPYRWYIVSNVQLSDNTAESEHWKFYTAGDGVSNYAPFPADLISPEQGTNFSKEIQQVTLEWESSDIDDEHIVYDVYLGSENPPLEKVASNLTEQTLDISAQFASEMFWRVVTRDENGNSSNSKVGNFGVAGQTGIISFEIQENDTTYGAEIDTEHNVIHIVLGNFAYEKLAPKILLKNGYTINPASDQPFNFHDDLFYIVADANGNETVYDVVVDSGQHEVKSFRVYNGKETYIGVIDSETATIYLELGNIDYSDITPEIELSPRANVEQGQVSGINLKSPVTFTVTSEIGTTKEFTVKAPIGMSNLGSYFWNPGFVFSDSDSETNYKVFAGSTQYLHVSNVQDLGQVSFQLLGSTGNSFSLPTVDAYYSHQHSFDKSNSKNHFTTEIPPNLPADSYRIKISEGNRSKTYPQRLEVINDERIIRITEINKTDFIRGDTLIIKGVNLKKDLMVKSDGSQYIFNNYTRDLSVNEEGTEMRLIFSTDVYGRLKSWRGSNEKPLGIQTTIEGYPYKLSSNLVYFNVN